MTIISSTYLLDLLGQALTKVRLSVDIIHLMLTDLTWSSYTK